MRKISHKSCSENQNTRFVFSNPPPPHTHTHNRAVYEIMWKNIVQRDSPSSSSVALQPGVGLGLLYNTPPGLSIPCSSLHSFIPIFLRFVDTSSSHLIFGLPLRLVATNSGTLHRRQYGERAFRP